MYRFLFVVLLLPAFVFGQQLQMKNCAANIAASFRGLSVVNDSIAWVSGTHGQIGKSTDGGSTWSFTQVKNFSQSDFRSIYAFNEREAIIANAGAPAYILRTDDGGTTWSVVYQNNDTAAFFDGIDFWNDKQGMIYGDPIKGRMLLLTTPDGGKSWKELPVKNRPMLQKGEASFAASGTNIHCLKKNKIIIATGGKVSRLFVSDDKGKHWSVRNTPILQGQSTQGIFSFAYNNKTLVIVGGDYKNDSLAIYNVFYSGNDGKTWKTPVTNTRGYRECVLFIDNNKVIALGPSGVDFSKTGGTNWLPLSDEQGFHVLKKARHGKLVIAAGANRISKLEFE